MLLININPVDSLIFNISNMFVRCGTILLVLQAPAPSDETINVHYSFV